MSACKDKKSEGLPPAQEWSSSTGAPMPPAPTPKPGMGANPHGGAAAGDPHAGMNMGGGAAGDPHAGMDMGGGAANPHGTGSPDVSKMGLAAPDPNRKIDPNHRVTGTIKVHPKAKDRVKAGGAVFVVIKKADANGQPSGPPLAVDRLEWKDGLEFKMTDAQSMIAGTELSGDVVVTVRYDQDSDAISKQPGDVVGTARVTVPADKVAILLDEVLP